MISEVDARQCDSQFYFILFNGRVLTFP